jgi:Leucine-rich repeat (LRR) protein
VNISALGSLHKLEHLSLRGQRKSITSAGLQGLGACSTLRTLRLGGFSSSQVNFGFLAHLINLQHLTFSNLKLNDVALEPVLSLLQLESLELAGSRISDITVKRIAALPRLTRLNLRWCGGVRGFGFRDFTEHRGFAALQVLDVSFTGLGDEAVEYLARLPVLTHLDLSGNHLHNAGVEHLRRCHALTVLRLRALPDVTQDVDLSYLQEITSLQCLDLSRNVWLRDFTLALASLDGLRCLRKLDLSHCKNVFGRGLTTLPTSLLELNLSHCPIIGQLHLHISRLRSLVALDLSTISLSDADVAFICTLRDIRVLILNKLRRFTDDDVALLRSAHSLTSLDLSYNPLITDRVISNLTELNLEVLNLQGCKHVSKIHRTRMSRETLRGVARSFQDLSGQTIWSGCDEKFGVGTYASSTRFSTRSVSAAGFDCEGKVVSGGVIMCEGKNSLEPIEQVNKYIPNRENTQSPFSWTYYFFSTINESDCSSSDEIVDYSSSSDNSSLGSGNNKTFSATGVNFPSLLHSSTSDSGSES